MLLQEKESPRVAFLSKFGSNNSVPQYRTLLFSTIRLVLPPPLQFPQLIFFYTSAIRHFTVYCFTRVPKTIPAIPTKTSFLPLYLSHISTIYLFIQPSLQPQPKILSPITPIHPIQAATRTQLVKEIFLRRHYFNFLLLP